MAALVKRKVLLFYDVVSPFAWIGFEVLCRYRKIWNLDLQLKPFLLGPVMQSAGNTAPIMVPNKADYLKEDLRRRASFVQLPLNMPENFAEIGFRERGSLDAMRLLTACSLCMPDRTERLSRELWLQLWSRGKDIRKLSVIQEAVSNAGLSEEESGRLMTLMTDSKTKTRLKQVTSEAIGYKAFGAPTILISDDNGKPHMFFGSDKFDVIAHVFGLKYEGPVPHVSSKM